jgi:hypothetical protein
MKLMADRFKVKRNDNCPCLSGKKYKYCCEGRVDWNRIIKEREDYRNFLSIRGRNKLFFEAIADALQFDSKTSPPSLKQYKAAFTSDAVKKIHESILEIWPPNIDISATLSTINADVSGLYIGDYTTKYILKGLVRHSIYANKLIVLDPFIYPLSVRDEFNPILNPSQYRTQTLKNVNFWIALLPWIEAGIVEIIRTPADFDRKLNWDSLHRQKKKYAENEELRKALKKSTEEFKVRHMEEERFRNLILSAPNRYLEKVFNELKLEKHGITIEQFIDNIEKLREEDPDFLEPLGKDKETSELHTFSTGTSYDIAKLTTSLTGSYLVTDIYSKWKEIEIDRKNHHVENKEWAPFAKAFQNVELKYLNDIRLNHALILRKEQRLQSLRVFLRRVWKSACTDEPFSEINAKLLADELEHEINKAEEEWKQIDRDLWKWFGAELSAGLLTAGQFIVTGSANFFAAVVAAAAGTSALLSANAKRKGHQDKFPAAFFMKLKT